MEISENERCCENTSHEPASISKASTSSPKLSRAKEWPVLSQLAAKLLSWGGVCFNLIPASPVTSSAAGRDTPPLISIGMCHPKGLVFEPFLELKKKLWIVPFWSENSRVCF